ncbi:MAG: PAS domain-containing protein [Anaeromyxobacter sp.]|nr:PAS domain-containing protein [Anaeromyxobacter sp.]
MSLAAGAQHDPAAAPRPAGRRGPPAAYLVAAAATLLAFGLRLALADYLGPPYLLFFPAVALSAILGGFRAGLTSAALAGILTAAFILPAGWMGGPHVAREAGGLAAFLVVSTLLSALAGRYRLGQRTIRALEVERARREGEARFGNLADAAPVLIWMAGVDGGGTWFNRTWLEFTGRLAAQELGDGWAGGVHPEDRPGCLALYRDHFARRAPFTMEYRLRRHDGAYRWVSATGSPRLDERGAFAGYLGACLDLTERREAEEALRLNQERLDLALRSGRLGLWDLDFATDQAWRTLQHDRIFGYETLLPTWGVGDALRHVVPEDRPIFERAFAEAFATDHFHYELRIHPEGQPLRWIAADGEISRDAAGRPSRMRGTVVDVTERKELDARAARAERLSAVSTLVRGMSHEINSPLACVVSNLDVAREQVDSVSALAVEAWRHDGHAPLAEVQEALADAAANADRIKLIVKDMTTFLPQQHRVELRADPAAALQVALELAEEELRPCAAVTLAVAALPDLAVSREELIQVFFSLLANAGQATGSGPNRVHVAGAPGPPGWVTFTIADSGVGMTPFVLQHVFEPFFTTRGVGRGKGLGLPLCRGVVDSVGGHLAFQSEVDQGTTVTVRLPACPTPPA